MKITEFAKKYFFDAVVPTSKGLMVAPGLATFKVTFEVVKPDGTPTGKKVVKMIGAKDKSEAGRIAEDMERKDRKLQIKSIDWAGKTTIASGPMYKAGTKFKKDSAEFENDAYNLGINIPENVSKEPVKVISVTAKKEQDGISGVVKFYKGKKTYSEYFMVYRSGNWDVKPISNTGMNYTPEDRTKLMDSVRNKLLKYGIKAK